MIQYHLSCAHVSDDIDDGTTSSVDNGATKNDEWSGNQKGNGTNASEHERTESGTMLFEKLLYFHLFIY